MDHYERSKLADAVKEKKYSKNEQIIKQGETSFSKEEFGTFKFVPMLERTVHKKDKL